MRNQVKHRQLSVPCDNRKIPQLYNVAHSAQASVQTQNQMADKQGANNANQNVNQNNGNEPKKTIQI